GAAPRLERSSARDGERTSRQPHPVPGPAPADGWRRPSSDGPRGLHRRFPSSRHTALGGPEESQRLRSSPRRPRRDANRSWADYRTGSTTGTHDSQPVAEPSVATVAANLPPADKGERFSSHGRSQAERRSAGRDPAERHHSGSTERKARFPRRRSRSPALRKL